jgi:5-methylcytosine-specific restriction enzyme subunit McrC
MTSELPDPDSAVAGPSAPGDEPVRLIGRVPVRNLWWLQLYALDLPRTAGISPVELDHDTVELPDVLARLLCDEVDRRLLRPLTPGYTAATGAIRRVRGRIDQLATARGQHWQQGRVVCTWQELQTDTPRQRLALAAILKLAALVREADIRRVCVRTARALQDRGVSVTRPDRRMAQNEVFGRHDSHDRTMVALSQLALDLVVPSEEEGPSHLPAVDRTEHYVRALFEKAVAGYYRATLAQGWTIETGQVQRWPVQTQSTRLSEWLPVMRLDMVIYPPTGPVIVIDTKFTSITAAGHHGLERFKSGHLYQLFTYLCTRAPDPRTVRPQATGVLLYPAINDRVDEWMVLRGHQIRLCTVDLASNPARMRADLDAVVRSATHVGP